MDLVSVFNINIDLVTIFMRSFNEDITFDQVVNTIPYLTLQVARESSEKIIDIESPTPGKASIKP